MLFVGLKPGAGNPAYTVGPGCVRASEPTRLEVVISGVTGRRSSLAFPPNKATLKCVLNGCLERYKSA
jgi:hypothetical protein